MFAYSFIEQTLTENLQGVLGSEETTQYDKAPTQYLMKDAAFAALTVLNPHNARSCFDFLTNYDEVAHKF